MSTFNSGEMFEAVGAMIEGSAVSAAPIRDQMRPYFEYCFKHGTAYRNVWERLSQLPYEEDFERLTDWLTGLLDSEPPGRDINGLWFGLFNPSDSQGEPVSQLYLAGSKRFDKVRPYSDWACNPEYFPEGRYATSQILPAIYRAADSIETNENLLGEACLCYGYAASIINIWCSQDSALSPRLIGDNGERAVAIGHDSGDYYFIHLPS